MMVASDPWLLATATAAKRLGQLFRQLRERSAYHKRRLQLNRVIRALIAEFGVRT